MLLLNVLPRPNDAILDDGYLRWTWYPTYEERGKRFETRGARKQPPHLQKPASDLCLQFAQLAGAPDQDILEFAKRWGPLHGKSEESISEWKQYAALADALLRFASAHIKAHQSSDADWSVICGYLSIEKPGRLSLNERRAFAAAAVNTWFAEATKHRILGLVNDQFQILPGASHLFGVLVTQIAQEMAGADELAVCSGCRKPFRPDRPISRGSRQYCEKCRKAKIPRRDASRDYRRRIGSKG